jgi:hypothetical protein
MVADCVVRRVRFFQKEKKKGSGERRRGRERRRGKKTLTFCLLNSSSTTA